MERRDSKANVAFRLNESHGSPLDKTSKEQIEEHNQILLWRAVIGKFAFDLVQHQLVTTSSGEAMPITGKVATAIDVSSDRTYELGGVLNHETASTRPGSMRRDGYGCVVLARYQSGAANQRSRHQEPARGCIQ